MGYCSTYQLLYLIYNLTYWDTTYDYIIDVSNPPQCDLHVTLQHTLTYTTHSWCTHPSCHLLSDRLLLFCCAAPQGIAAPLPCLIEPSRSVIKFQWHLGLSSSLQADTGDRFNRFLRTPVKTRGNEERFRLSCRF